MRKRVCLDMIVETGEEKTVSDFENPFDDAANPYAATIASDDRSGALTEAEIVRKKYLNHEASIKSMGTLFMLGAVLSIPLAVITVARAIRVANSPSAQISLLIGVMLFGVAVAQGITGFALQKFQPWTRVAGSVLAAIGLIGFPIGTLIATYFLYLLLSRKGHYVFSDEYQDIIAETPHIKYKTSKIVWAFLILLLSLLALGIGAALFSRSGP